MFKNVSINFDYKDLETLKNALENEINHLNNNVFITEEVW